MATSSSFTCKKKGITSKSEDFLLFGLTVDANRNFIFV